MAGKNPVHDFDVVFLLFQVSTFKIYLLRHFPTDFCDSTFNTKVRLEATIVTNFIGEFFKKFFIGNFFSFFFVNKIIFHIFSYFRKLGWMLEANSSNFFSQCILPCYEPKKKNRNR